MKFVQLKYIYGVNLFSGAHSLWELPILTLRYGGVVFVLVYLVLFLLLGVPMMLLEMTLGQYAALAPTKFFRNLSPVRNPSKSLWNDGTCIDRVLKYSLNSRPISQPIEQTLTEFDLMIKILFQSLSGVGFAVALTLLLQASSDLAVVTW